MIIKFKFSKDCQENPSIKIDKLFQFVVIGEKQNDNQRSVEIYTAISFKRNIDKLNTGDVCLKIEPIFEDYTSPQENNINYSYIDRSIYYKEIDILKQFWGKDSRAISDRGNFATSLGLAPGDQLNNRISGIYNIKSELLEPIIIEEPSKNIEKFAVIPCISMQGNDKIILKGSDVDIISGKLSYGFWFKVSHVGFFKEHEQIELEHSLDFTFPFNSDDFKIYYQIPKHYDIRKGKVSCSGDVESSSEIVKVYSQHRIKYFEEWRENGIYDSALFRVLNNKSFDDNLKEIGNKNFLSQIEIFDNRTSRMREVYTLLVGIFISTFISMGLDATRLLSADHQRLLSFTIFGEKIPASIIWTLIAAGLILKCLGIFNGSLSRRRRIIYVMMSMPILIHSFIVLNLPDKAFTKNLYDGASTLPLLIYWDVIFTTFICSGKIIRHRLLSTRQNLRSKGKEGNWYKYLGKAVNIMDAVWGIKK